MWSPILGMEHIPRDRKYVLNIRAKALPTPYATDTTTMHVTTSILEDTDAALITFPVTEAQNICFRSMYPIASTHPPQKHKMRPAIRTEK